MQWMIAATLVACSSPETADPTVPTDPGGTSPTSSPTSPAPAPSVVHFDTRDGVTLEADWYPTASLGRPAVVLLHMIPPANDRTNWPASFIERLAARQWAVLAVDRRGAGGSGGVAVDAYLGPNGKLDVEAAALFLQAEGAGDLAILGASNGTTSMLDYSAWAEGEGLPVPVAVGFMTGGDYTVAQTGLDLLPPIPAVFTYSTAERTWSVKQQPLDPGSWSFLEYDGGAHGTRMFDAKPRVRGDLEEFLAPFLDSDG